MDMVSNKRQIAFRLSADLLERLRIEAMKEQSSLNNYVEGILNNVVYKEPNGEPLDALHQAKASNGGATNDTRCMKMQNQTY